MTVPQDAGRAGVPATPQGAALLVSSVRRAVVDALAQLDGDARAVGLSAAELGVRLGLHSTTIRFHVDQLVTAGVIEAHFVRSGSVGRPSKKYHLPAEVTVSDDRAGGDDSPFEVLAGLLAAAMSASEPDRITPEEAGVRWAQGRAAQLPPVAGPEVGRRSDEDTTAAVVDLLGAWGYRPETSTVPGGGVVDITLRDCPFLDLAATHPDVVCGVHRGLLRGALGAVGADHAQVSLHPFVSVDTCRARLYLDTPEPGVARLDPGPVPAAPSQRPTTFTPADRPPAPPDDHPRSAS